jgi:hypothetical protein
MQSGTNLLELVTELGVLSSGNLYLVDMLSVKVMEAVRAVSLNATLGIDSLGPLLEHVKQMVAGVVSSPHAQLLIVASMQNQLMGVLSVLDQSLDKNASFHVTVDFHWLAPQPECVKRMDSGVMMNPNVKVSPALCVMIQSMARSHVPELVRKTRVPSDAIQVIRSGGQPQFAVRTMEGGLINSIKGISALSWHQTHLCSLMISK